MKKVMLTSVCVVLLLLIAVKSNAQYYVGKQASEIKSLIKKDNPYLKLNTTDVNKVYKYLKYEDRINEITALFFLDEKDKCKMVRIMYDYSNINDVIKFLEENMEKVAENKFEYKPYDKPLLVEMSEGDWFFTLTIKAK